MQLHIDSDQLAEMIAEQIRDATHAPITRFDLENHLRRLERRIMQSIDDVLANLATANTKLDALKVVLDNNRTNQVDPAKVDAAATAAAALGAKVDQITTENTPAPTPAP